MTTLESESIEIDNEYTNNSTNSTNMFIHRKINKLQTVRKQRR